MSTKIKAIAVLALMGVGIASPALAQPSRIDALTAQTQEARIHPLSNAAHTGGGSAGYNFNLKKDV